LWLFWSIEFLECFPVFAQLCQRFERNALCDDVIKQVHIQQKVAQGRQILVDNKPPCVMMATSDPGSNSSNSQVKG